MPSLLGLALLIAVYPPSAFERSLIRLLASLPDWLDPLWEIVYDTLGLLALALAVLALAGRRPAVLAQAALSVALGVAITVVSSRLAVGRWPDPDDLARLRVDEATFPVLRVALAATVVLAVVPHLVRPLQRAARWILLLGLLGGVLVEAAAPSGTLAALLVALVAATVVRLAFGTSAGHPEADDVTAALRELGIEVEQLEPADRQPAGVFVARGLSPAGEPLLVKVYGRDAYDTQLLEKVWRTALYADDGPRLSRSRLEAVEHEALVTLLAQRAGVPTRDVLAAAESSTGDAVLVFRDGSRSFAPLAGDDVALARAWKAVAALGAARIAHHRIDPDTLVAFGDEVGLVDLDRATIAARPEHVLVDRAQLHATLAALAGVDRAVAAAFAALGPEGLAALLPYLQPAGFGPGLSRALDAADVDVDDLRDATAAAAGVERRPSSGSGASPGARSSRSGSSRSRCRPSSATSAGSTTATSRMPSRTHRGAGSRWGSCSHRRRVSHRRSRRSDRSPHGSRTCRSTSCSWPPATSISRSPRTSHGWRSTSASSSGTESRRRRRSPRARSTRSSRR